ncbi:MAG: DEAD/DEAH box helicase [Pirellulales bacterium]|nr:DEAD/DEAH box helicase [Pirellulales bacterium]
MNGPHGWLASRSAGKSTSAEPRVASLDCRLPVATEATGWQTALARPPKIRLLSAQLELTRPAVTSGNFAAPAVRVRSFQFAPPAGNPFAPQQPNPPTARPAPSTAVPAGGGAGAHHTRLRPPADVIKLEDRLYYVLQPSLEAVVSRQALHFPFQPFPYQYEGIAFLYPRHAAILADEMGLGKTMQAVTAIRLLLHAGEIRNALLICPKPLVTNWQREFNLWAPEIPLTVIEGDQARRRWQWHLADAPVRIANYELLQRDRDTLLAPERHFDLVVLDESQRIKNRSNQTATIVRQMHRDRSWALTGTPVENSAEDLVGIFEFVSPGTLHADMKPRRMGQIAGGYVLRRTKDLVLTDMPPRLDRDAEVELSDEQRESYRLAEEEGVLRLAGLGAGATIQHVFELVLRLKQICNFDPATGESAKLERLAADLEEVAASGQKALVFSQWVQTLDELAARLKRFGTLSYHGRVPAAQRDGVLQRFREDRSRHVLLMSYGAGGVGLNLQFANYVFLFDRWWNPAVEDQAINRAHRIGVAGPVTVTRFVTRGTIEERIDQVLRDKRELFDTIFSDAQPQAHLGLSRDEIFGLFDLRVPGGKRA